jgi:hypothetical protein
MLTVVHKGATVSTHVLVLSPKIKKIHWAGRPYENPLVLKVNLGDKDRSNALGQWPAARLAFCQLAALSHHLLTS